MEQLFGSKTRVKLLKLFMSNPNRSFYVREITRKIDEQINSVRRELANLLSLGIITSDSTNHKLYYEVDQKNKHYTALRMLFTGKAPKVAKSKVESRKSKVDEPADNNAQDKQKVKPTSEEPYADQKLWEKAGNIVGLLYSGAFTRDTNSPVDIMVVGDVTIARVEAAVAKLEKEKNKELRYAVMEVDEWRYRQQVNDRFFSEVISAKKQIVKDGQELFVRK